VPKDAVNWIHFTVPYWECRCEKYLV